MNPDQRQARLEDLTWMVENGETAERAARRLGITRNALEKWASHNDPDLWRRLCAQEPLPLDSLQAHTLMMRRGRVKA